MKLWILTALLLAIATVASTGQTIERTVTTFKGQHYVQRFCWHPQYGWVPASDKHPCNESRRQVLSPQYPYLSPPRAQTPQPYRPHYLTPAELLKKGLRTVPEYKRTLDCDPKQTYRCFVQHMVNGQRKTVQVGGEWRPVGIFKVYRTNQEMIAYEAVGSSSGERYLCTLAEWQLIMVRRYIPESKDSKVQAPAPPPEQIPMRKIDLRDKDSGK